MPESARRTPSGSPDLDPSPAEPARRSPQIVMRACLVALALSACPAVSLAQTVPITTNVAANATWGPTGTVVGDIFWVQNNISINGGVTLTIQPGVIVKFDAGRQLTVNGALLAQGTGGSEITFTSIRDDVGGDTNGDLNATTPAAGDWAGLSFPDVGSDGSVLDYCVVGYAGLSSGAAITFTNNSSTVSNTTIEVSTYGIDCKLGSSPTLSDVTINSSTQAPIIMDVTAAPAMSGIVFSSGDNGYDAIALRGGTLSGTGTLSKQAATVGATAYDNVTYVLVSSLSFNSGASLTIDPGVVIKMLNGSITVNTGANLTMNGTAAAGDTITITSIHDDTIGEPLDTNNNGSITAPAPGNWGRVVYQPGSTGSVQRCRLKFGTNTLTQALVEMNSVAVNVSSSLLSDAAHGLGIFGTVAPAISDVVIQNCTSTPVLQSVSATPAYSNMTFLANTITAVGLRGETITDDSRIPVLNLAGYDNITYYVMNGAITMQSPAVLRIDPGVVVKNAILSGGFVINGAMVADGKPDSLIVFTSERDDAYGNPADTNGDGAATSPAVSDWGYIQFGASSNAALNKLNDCRVTYGSYAPGNAWRPCVWIVGNNTPITNCVIDHGLYGIRFDGAATSLFDQNTVTGCTNAPIVMSAMANPNITAANTYSANGYNALALTTESVTQNSTIRYRAGVGSPTFAYLPTGTITVANGVTLAIEPQVVVKPTGAFTLFSVDGTLNVVGSDATSGRVVFTSRLDDNVLHGGDTTPNDANAPQAGDWGSIQFNDSSVDAACVVRNCLFQFGAALGQEQGVLTTANASPRLAGNEFFQNKTAMTFKGTSQPTVDSTTILNCTQLPIVWSLVSDPQFPQPANVTFANNAFTALGIIGETIGQDVTTRVRGLGGISNMPYAPTGTITISFGAKWTLAPGVVVKLGRRVIDPIGTTITVDGALVANGKPDSLIVFTSTPDDAFGGDTAGDGALVQPAPANWLGIYFTANSDDLVSVLNYCRIRYGGYSNLGALRFTNAGPTVSNTYVTKSNGPGVQIEGASSPTFNDCFFDSSSTVPVQMSLVSQPTFNNVQFLGNTYTAIGIIAESIAQDVLWPIRAASGRNNMPYLLQGQLITGLGATVTLQPGLVVKNTANASIKIQRAFVAEGRTPPESLIVFTSYRDDFYGGDTNNDGTTTTPTAGDWNYVWVDGTAIDPDVRFKNCVFRYGGSGTTVGALRAVNSSPSVDSCTFSYNSVGISVEGASDPTITGSSIYGNTQYGVNNTGNSFCVYAEGNWWGATSGPNDASASVDLCSLGANAGSGDKVSNNVDYTSWTTSGIQNPLLGDVSLNGLVLAYDASLVMQYVALLTPLSPLQELVADVSGTAGVTAFDASLILQYVAKLIPAFPAASNGLTRSRADLLVAQRLLERSQGSFTVTLGTAVRDGADWLVPVHVTGSAPIYSLELKLSGASADGLGDVQPESSSALEAHGTGGGLAHVAVASAEVLPAGEVVTLRFSGGDGWVPPTLSWARVNENELDPVASSPGPSTPAISFLASPAPNPAGSAVRFSLGVSLADAGWPSRVVVYDLAGRVSRVLQDGALSAGVHDFRWDLSNTRGRRVAPGVYLVHARTRTQETTQRLVVVR